WLSPLDFGEKHNTVFEKRARDTGEWFLEHPKFLAWRRGDPGYGAIPTLWCPGNPGVGKSVMASLVINELRKEVPENAALVFIYFEYRTNYTASQLAEVVLKQLVQRRITQSGLESLRKHKAGNRPTYEELFNMLKVEVGTYDCVVIVIDALDEADIEIWTQLLGCLRGLHKISLIATSRDISRVELKLRPYQRLDIVVDGRDMRKYIEERLKSSVKLDWLRQDVHEEIITKIIMKASRMFLLARLHMNSLETKHRDLRQALNKLPNTLDATYDKAMSRIIHDLQYALAVGDGTASTIDIDDLHNEASLTSICVGLVVLQEDAVLPMTIYSDYTAQEYFLRNQKVSERFANSPNFAITCLRYLAFDIFKADESLRREWRLTETPFAKLSDNWICHVVLGVHAHMYCDDKTIRNLAMELLHDSKRVAKVGSVPCRAKNPSAIHLCTHFGLKDYLESLLDSDCNVNLKDSNGDTAVTYAALGGQTGILQLLLTKEGVDVNPKGQGGLTPLARAVIGGHEATAQLLLARSDLDVNRHDNFGNAPIIHAAQEGHSRIMRLLLSRHDVNINLQDQNGCTPLLIAAYGGHEDLVQALLTRNDLDVNRCDDFGNTPLIYAAQEGRGKIVKLLLARDDVDIN
ncbi:ankyrin repeat-containing domain protein, partial [Infundibulicybe gibba]